MKLRSLLFGLLLCASAASAADVITRTDGTTIDAMVEEITETTIRYRKASNPKGPVYSIPVASVVKIVYDNGSTDNFNTPADTTPQTAVPSTSPSDEELMRYAETIAPTEGTTGKMSDAELLRLVHKTPINPKAKKYRLIGWIGGGVCVLGGAIGAIIAYKNINKDINHYIQTGENGPNFSGDDYYDMYKWKWIVSASVGVGCGAIWTSAFLIRANQITRQAEALEMYSSSIIEDEILHFGDKSLTAGVSVMGNQMTRTQGYGLSFKLNF